MVAPAARDARAQRFDGASARAILERAAAEQARRNSELAGSYTVEELEEMAAEAGISREALRAALDAHASGDAARGPVFVRRERSRRGRSALDVLVPGPWSRTVKGIVVAAAGGLGVVGLAFAFPALAQTVAWALLAFLLLVALLLALGASPF